VISIAEIQSSRIALNGSQTLENALVSKRSSLISAHKNVEGSEWQSHVTLPYYDLGSLLFFGFRSPEESMTNGEFRKTALLSYETCPAHRASRCIGRLGHETFAVIGLNSLKNGRASGFYSYARLRLTFLPISSSQSHCPMKPLSSFPVIFVSPENRVGQSSLGSRLERANIKPRVATAKPNVSTARDPIHVYWLRHLPVSHTRDFIS